MANAPYGSGGYQYNNQPSPYMTSQSAGNPASSYGSQGGSQAGPWGQPAPQQQQQGAPSPLWTKNTSGGGYTYSGPGSTAAAHPQGQPQQQGGGSWSWPQQQQGGYQYQPQPAQPPPQPQYQQPQQPTQWQYPQGTPQQPPSQQGDPYAAWMAQIMAPYNPQGGGYAPYQQQGGAPPTQQPTPGRAYVPPQGVNTDGYPQPQITQMPQANAMPGWDNSKWRDPNHQTPKYVVGRLLQDIPPRTENMAMAMQRIQAAYPGARQIGPGDVSIPGVGSIDILQSAGAGGRAWQWGGGDSAKKFPTNASQGGSGGGYPIQTAGGGGDLSSLIAMLMGGPQPQMQTMAQQPAAPKVDPKIAQAAALQKQRDDTAAAEAKRAAGPGGVHPSFAYY